MIWEKNKCTALYNERKRESLFFWQLWCKILKWKIIIFLCGYKISTEKKKKILGNQQEKEGAPHGYSLIFYVLYYLTSLSFLISYFFFLIFSCLSPSYVLLSFSPLILTFLSLSLFFLSLTPKLSQTSLFLSPPSFFIFSYLFIFFLYPTLSFS